MTSKWKLSGIIAGGTFLLCALFVVPAMADSTMMKVGVKQNMDAHLMTPDGAGRYPAILILHTSGGLQPGDLDFASRLVQQGYVVLVPEFLKAYGIQPQARRSTFTTYAQPIYMDLKASLDQLRSNNKVDGKRLAAIGFSNGAYFALWLAATNQVQAGVSYYGALTGAGTDKSLSRFRQVFTDTSSPVLILHGTSDSTVPVTNAIELDSLLTASQTPHAFYQYAGAEHRFDRDMGASNEAAATDAWQRTLAFLTKILKR
jgi:carboxymethylenebutenolidase